MSAADILANMALRCSDERLNRRPLNPWRMDLSPYVTAAVPRNGRYWFPSPERERRSSVVFLEPLGEVLDVLRRPARHFHAEVQAHAGEHFLDLVERLTAEVRSAQHLPLALLDEVADVDDVVVLQAVGGAHRQLELVDLLEQRRVEGSCGAAAAASSLR